MPVWRDCTQWIFAKQQIKLRLCYAGVSQSGFSIRFLNCAEQSKICKLSHCLPMRKMSPKSETFFISKMGDILPIERHLIVLGSVYFTTQFVSKNGRQSLDSENVSIFENLALLTVCILYLLFVRLKCSKQTTFKTEICNLLHQPCSWYFLQVGYSNMILKTLSSQNWALHLEFNIYYFGITKKCRYFSVPVHKFHILQQTHSLFH